MGSDEQFNAWLELEQAAIRAELQLRGQQQIESDPEQIAKFNAAAKLRQEADALLNEMLDGPRSVPPS